MLTTSQDSAIPKTQYGRLGRFTPGPRRYTKHNTIWTLIADITEFVGKFDVSGVYYIVKWFLDHIMIYFVS